MKAEIEQHLEQAGLAVFYGLPRSLDSMPTVYWDSQEHPDYRDFIRAASATGAKMVVLSQLQFHAEQVDDALEQLVECELPRDEYRDFERRLKDARAYAGFVCEIELSFEHEGCMFLFDLRTDWYQDLTDVLDEIRLLTSAEEEDETDSLGGYFSKN